MDGHNRQVGQTIFNSHASAFRQPTFNELLIQEVQGHPELYDQQHRVCTDSTERNVIWETISQKIDQSISGEFAKKRWLQMRDRYRKELKMAIRNRVQPKWPYFEKLAWLDPYLKDSKNVTGGSLELGNREESGDASDSFDLSDFQYPSNLSTNLLLENLMAVTSNMLGNRQYGHSQSQRSLSESNAAAEYSPDSAIASTSDDGDIAAQFNGSLPTASSLPKVSSCVKPTRTTLSPPINDSEENITNYNNNMEKCSEIDASLHDSQQHEMEAKESNNTSPFQQHESTPENQPDQKPLSADHSINSPCSPANTSFEGSLPGIGEFKAGLRQTRTRLRNPPYLVRRGGSVKVKSPNQPINSEPSLTLSHSNNTVAKQLKALKKSLSITSTPGIGTATASITPSPLGMSSIDGQSLGLMNQLQTLAGSAVFGMDHSDWLGSPKHGGKDVEWDEDLLFARLIVVRLRKFSTKDRRTIRAKINEWIDEKEEELEGSTEKSQ
ncbi:alcohol dehydrogenase transcription factor myb/SANT-like domain-containing protein [Ditylenchus destructor]|uniref:Alcohol dehydrogenase transcription factor myb/SANT-like domain-containing protein n=1 Tax=Ditylenchus destructor TaxID=166010 RepID=A0AAD4N9T7_9BILA|nr:alcohol dehydrogenase transcription factor myb/SANT-like domain-containing protein [Ditylenchus destructor]